MESVHIELGIEILESLYDPDKSGTHIHRPIHSVLADLLQDQDRITLCEILEKLYLPEEPAAYPLVMLNLLIRNIHTVRPFSILFPLMLFNRLPAKKSFRRRENMITGEKSIDVLTTVFICFRSDDVAGVDSSVPTENDEPLTKPLVNLPRDSVPALRRSPTIKYRTASSSSVKKRTTKGSLRYVNHLPISPRRV